jgi:hypothetical protein
MFMCTYKKADNVVYQVRNDTSVPQTTSAAQYFADFCSDNQVSSVDYNYAEMPFQSIDLVIGKYLYQQNTNSIVLNPDWIEPPAPETSSIPVADPEAT